MARQIVTYAIPIRLHKKAARSKAAVAYYQQWQGGKLWMMLPVVGAKVVVVRASTHAEAYRSLCQIVLPGDARPIMGKWAIKHFRQDIAAR